MHRLVEGHEVVGRLTHAQEDKGTRVLDVQVRVGHPSGGHAEGGVSFKEEPSKGEGSQHSPEASCGSCPTPRRETK